MREDELSDLPSIGIWPHERKRYESGMAKPVPVTQAERFQQPECDTNGVVAGWG
jgi:hypothetical protein